MVVDFSAKLEDNKVYKWRDSYVDYDKLVDGLFTKAKKVKAEYDSLAQARPDIAAEFELSAGISESNLGLGAIEEGGGEGGGEMSSERDPLADWSKGYGTGRDAVIGEREAYRRKLAKCRKELDGLVAKAKPGIRAERDKAADLYVKEWKTLMNGLELLINTVQSTYEMQPDPDRRANRRDTFILVKSARTLIAEKHQIDSARLDIDEEGEDFKPINNEVASVKRALVDLHRETMLLFNFYFVNTTALTLLVKRFNRIFPKRQIDIRDIMPEQYDGKKTAALNDRIIKIYAKWFCDNDTREASAQMMCKKGDSLELDWSQLRLGYRLGICLTLMIWMCFDCIWNMVEEDLVSIGGRSAFPVFRACGGLLLWHWCWGASAYVWRRYRINYIFMFDFDPKIVDEPMVIFNACVDETLVYLVTLLLYYKTATHGMPQWFAPGLYPFFLVLYTVSKLIFPLKKRLPLWYAIARVVTSPLSSASFFHTYVADVFTSMVKIFLDLLWTFCFIFSGDFLVTDTLDSSGSHSWQHSTWYKQYAVPLICLFPLYIRLMQCLRKYNDTGNRVPNLPNALKYTMSQIVTLFGAFYPVYHLRCHEEHYCSRMNIFQIVWLAIFVSSTLYSWVWDVKMDWGLGHRKYAWLGPRLMFPSAAYYYSVMAADLVLRFMWMQSLLPPSSGAHFEIPAYLTFMNMSLELLRRTLWSFFRLENQHRASTAHIKDAEDFVPLHFTTGHDHKYKHDKERNGRRVLFEVCVVGLIVFAMSMLSVIAAHKARVEQDL